MTALNDIANKERQLEYIYVNRYQILKMTYYILLTDCNISYDIESVIPTEPQVHIAGEDIISINSKERVNRGSEIIKFDRSFRNQNYINYKINTTITKKSQLF